MTPGLLSGRPPTRARPATRLAFLAPLLLAGCGGGGQGEPAEAEAWSPETAPLLVGATRDGRTDLHLHDPARGRTVPVVATDLSEVQPALAPDGRRLSYHARGRATPYNLYLAEPGGAGEEVAGEVRTTRLAGGPDVHAIGSVWSPDGRELAYFSNRGLRPGDLGAFPGHLYARDMDTGEERRLTEMPLPGTLGPSDWSADGRWILMARPFDGQIDVVRLNVATGAEERLTDGPEDEYGARWSHDGTRIAFHVEDGDGAWIAVLDLATGVRTRVTREPGWWFGPVWSPDDAWLLVNTGGLDGVDYDVVAVRVRDGHLLPLVDTGEDERYAIWIPRSSPWAAAEAAAPEGGPVP